MPDSQRLNPRVILVIAVAALGYTNVKHYTGGLAGWKEAGGKLQQN